MGVVAPTRKLEREKEHGVIRPMSTMEKWAMSAQEAYASKDPMKRLEVVPDIGPAAGLVKRVPTELVKEIVEGGALWGTRQVKGIPGSRIEFVKRAPADVAKTRKLMGLKDTKAPTYDISWVGTEGAPIPGSVAKSASDPAHLSSLLKDFMEDVSKRHPGELVEIHAPASSEVWRSMFEKHGTWVDEYKFGQLWIKDGKVVKSLGSKQPKKTTLSPTSSTRTKRGGAK